MQIKQRVLWVIFTFLCFLVILELAIRVFSQNREDSTTSQSGLSRTTFLHYSKELHQLNNLIDRLARHISSIKKSLLFANQEIIHKNERKDIYIDVLNSGDQKNCQNLSLLVMISSHAQHFNRRTVIRKSWANISEWRKVSMSISNFTFRVLFLVGINKNENVTKQLYRESKEHGDLLYERLDESFYSLSYKIMIGFQWVDEQCSFEYLLKGDDDIFINMVAVNQYLKFPYIPSKELYVGHMMTVSPVLRDGRYGVTREEYLRDFYPRYNSGGGFIMSRDVVNKIIPHYDWMQPLKIDDAYIGLLVLKAGIDSLDDTRFQMYLFNCVFIADALVYHIRNNEATEISCATHLLAEAIEKTLIKERL